MILIRFCICLSNTLICLHYKDAAHMLSRFSRVRLFATPWTLAFQAPLSVGFSRQEYWSEWPLPSPGDLPNPGIELSALKSPALAGRGFTAREAPLGTPKGGNVTLSARSDSATPRTVAHQAPLSMGFSRQEDWSGSRFPSPGDLPDPGVKPGSPVLQVDSLASEPPGKQCYIVLFPFSQSIFIKDLF